MTIAKNYVHVSATKFNQRMHAIVFIWFHYTREAECCFLNQHDMHSWKLARDSFFTCSWRVSQSQIHAVLAVGLVVGLNIYTY